MVVLENRGSGRDDVQIEEVLGASLVPSCLLLSCALLPVRLSRFRYVAGSAIASCVAAAIAFRSWYDGWQCLVVLCAAVIAQVIVHQREVILRRCFELTIQRDEKPVQVASHTLEKGEDVRCQETALARASALERLTRHLCDAFIELTDRYTLEQSPYLQAFFMQARIGQRACVAVACRTAKEVQVIVQ
ncbi:unnamed protein product [Durusdinium trenchii]|uniref:Uncharacterized protein n=1 Tax=Durusdinium trenchii TaxID=1381693 RepID=A0ABP0KRL6_9DINO